MEEEESNRGSSCDFSFKLVLVGDSGVGKSMLLKRLIQENSRALESEQQAESPEERSDSGNSVEEAASFLRHQPTIGVDFKTLVFNMNRSHIRVGLNFFDTSGAAQFRQIAASYFYNVQAFLIVYDVTNMQSFVNCQRWLAEITDVYSKICRNNSSTALIKILVGCKSDLASSESQRAVPTKKAKKFAKQNGFVLFYETSARDNLNVRELFEEMSLELIGNYLKFLTYQQSLIDFAYKPCTDKSPMIPASVYAISTKSDVYFNCQTENLNCNHIILNSLNSKRKNLQSEGYNFFDFSFFD